MCLMMSLKKWGDRFWCVCPRDGTIEQVVCDL